MSPGSWTEVRDEYLADGFTEEVIAGLSEVRDLRVISRTSSMTLKGTGKDAGSIARDLGVRHLPEGAVRRVGTRLRITVRLIDPLRDDRLWSKSMEGELEEVFAIQERIARRVVEALAIDLTIEEEERLSRRPLDDVAAW